MSRLLVAVWSVGYIIGCDRAPLETPCPVLSFGELVVTELASDWIELYNASDKSAAVTGLSIVLQPIRGDAPARILVRDASAFIAAHRYMVMGRRIAPFVDYVYAVDYIDVLPDHAQIRIESCANIIDQVVYESVPEMGSFGFDGVATPNATDNDDVQNRWCIDRDGSPGVSNFRCD